MRYYLNKLIYTINRFMYGRYKGDELNQFLIILYFAFWVLSFLPYLGFFRLINIIILIYVLYRALSKNIYARQKELNKYFEIKNKFKAQISLNKQKHQNRKTHLYFKCKNCKANLRVPKGKGKIEVTCPKCKQKVIKYS
ncbi:MAG: hypothetical protein E7551_03925 [Ruminococcaceae bacterium]|nr:hypothetical protein [Oscillospiraceae bacterium]